MLPGWTPETRRNSGKLCFGLFGEGFEHAKNMRSMRALIDEIILLFPEKKKISSNTKKK